MRLLLTLVFVIGLVGCSSSKESTAQDTRATTAANGQQPDRRQQAVENFQAISQRLALTDDQTEKIRPILAEQAEQTQAIREKYGLTGRGQGGGGGQRPDRSQMQAMRADLETVREQTEAKLSTVLSDTQMEEWKAMQAERQERRGQRGGRRGGRG
ncbi:MAG: hypothetical protein RhofKO_35450 [Rhodothermales bacterium]